MLISLFIVVVAALVIPLLMARFRVTQVPTAVAEISTGIILGQSGFNVLHGTIRVNFLSNIGVMMLLFLSGMEIDFALFRNKAKKGPDPVKISLLAFGATTVMSIILGLALKLMGLFSDLALAAIILATVSLGVVIAALTEKGILNKPIGQTILLTASLGEVVPLTALTIYSGLHSANPQRLWLLIILFLAAIILLERFRQPYAWFNKISKATTQLDIRLAFFLLFALVAVAEGVGAKSILGAFLAGMVMKLLDPSKQTRAKLTSIGYGFFIPIFFIMTGAGLNLRSLLANPQSLRLLPILVIAFILAKVPIMFVFGHYFDRQNALAGGFLTVTTITIVLPAVQVAQRLHVLSANQAGAFVLAAVIVCILSPIVFNSRFVLTPQDRIKETVSVIGANMYTVPAAQQLAGEDYLVRVAALDDQTFETYDSRVKNLYKLTHYDEKTLLASGLFDCDILLAGSLRDDLNYQIARLAKRHGVKRVIVCLRQPTPAQLDTIAKEDLALYNMAAVRSQVMHSLVAAPDLIDILLNNKNGLYEVQVENTRYLNKPLMEWDFIDLITISAIRRGKQWITPHGATVLQRGDHLIYTGAVKDAAHVKEVLRSN